MEVHLMPLLTAFSAPAAERERLTWEESRRWIWRGNRPEIDNIKSQVMFYAQAEKFYW
jgi:hypothetical protein